MYTVHASLVHVLPACTLMCMYMYILYIQCTCIICSTDGDDTGVLLHVHVHVAVRMSPTCISKALCPAGQA